MQKNNMLVIGAIVCSVLLLGFDIQTAYAVLTLELITPTGGNLSATSDCTKISASNGIIWHSCNDILYAINDTTHVVIANISATIAQNDMLTASIGTTAVYHASNTGNTVNRYTLSGDTISLTGTFAPASCTFGEELVYDDAGFLWIVCDTTDELIRFNPDTMTQVARSGDLTDSVGLECDLPTRVAYDNGENIGLAHCSTTGAVLTFEITSPTVMTLLDSETIASVVFITIDSFNNRFVVITSSGVTSYSYTALGILAVVNTATANNDNCDSEKAQSANGIFIVCADDSGTNTNVITYHLNSTGIFLLSSSAVAMDNHNGVGLQYGSGTNTIFYIVSNTNDQRYIKVSGVRDASLPPTPPDGGDPPRIVNGVNCDLPQNQGKLICVPDSENPSIFPDDKGAPDVANDFGCVLALLECEDGEPTDPNVQTNGIGLALTLVAEIVAVAMLTVASRGQLVHIHPVAWALVFVGIVGISFMFQFIELQWFLLVVFFSIAFVAIKIVPQFTGIGGGGSSA